MTYFPKSTGTGLASFLQRWTKNQGKGLAFLDEKYNKVLTRGKALLGLETEILLQLHSTDFIKVERLPKQVFASEKQF